MSLESGLSVASRPQTGSILDGNELPQLLSFLAGDDLTTGGAFLLPAGKTQIGWQHLK